MSFEPPDDETPQPDDAWPDPRSVPVAVDANALERNGRRDDAVERFMAMAASGALTLVIGDAVRAELSGEKPGGLAGAAPGRKPSPGLSAARHIARIRVRAIVCGNARPGKHDADALHLSEAAEAGCGYFITYDSRILRKRGDLETIAVPGLKIVTLEDFLAIYDRTRPPDR